MEFLRVIIYIYFLVCAFLSYSQNTYYNLGEYYASEGNYVEAVRLTRLSLTLNKQLADTNGIFFDHLTLSNYFSYINQADSCKYYADLALGQWQHVEGLEYSEFLGLLSLYFNRVGLSRLAIDYRKNVVDIYIEKYGVDSPKLVDEYHIISSFAKAAGDKTTAIEYSKQEENLAYKTRNVEFDNRRLTYEDSFGWLQYIIQECEEPIIGIHYLLTTLNEHRDAINKERLDSALAAIWVICKDHNIQDGCIAVYKERALYGTYEEQFRSLSAIYAEDENIPNDVNAPIYAKALYDLALQDNVLSQYFSQKEIQALFTILPNYYRRIGLSHNQFEVGKKGYEWRKINNMDINLLDVDVLASGFSVLSTQLSNDSLTNFLIDLGEEILNSGRYENDSETRNLIYTYLVGGYLKLADQEKADKYITLLDTDDNYDSLYSKAFAHFMSGDVKLAYPLFVKLSEHKDTLTQDKDDLLFMRIMSARAMRSIKELQDCSREYIFRYRDKILYDLPLLSEDEKINYLRKSIFSSILSYDYFIGTDEDNNLAWSFPKEAYDYTLLKKGLLLTSQRELRNILNNSNDSLIQSKWKLFQQQEKYFSMQNEILKRELLTYASKQSSQKSKLDYTWEDVKNALKEGEVAIEFIKLYNFYEFDNVKDFDTIDIDPLYLALLVRYDSSEPTTIILSRTFYAKGLDEEDHSLLLAEDNTTIYNLLYKPLERYLDGIKTIYFSPIEDLNSIAMEYASMGNGERVCDKWNLIRLSSTREVVNNISSPKKETAVLYGGLRYDLGKDELIAESRSGDYHPTATSRAFTAESSRYGVKYLPGTLKEVEEISQNFSSTPRLVTDISGTEESFKSLAGTSTDIIHLATHGFFWTEDDAQKRDYVTFLNPSNRTSQSSEDKALMRSGLFFSGANIGLKGEALPDDVEDGVLTALELSNMNLGNVDMVVMSACESGLGETSGEGVFGLQRGFKLAGANTLLMSLWKVDDVATQMLMTEFYKHYLSGKSKQESLHLAQQTVRNSSEYSDPQYWAAFILLDGNN